MNRGDGYNNYQQHHPRDGSPSSHHQQHHFDKKPYNNQYDTQNFGDTGNNNYDVKYDKKKLFLKGVPKNLTESQARRVFQKYGTVTRFDQPKFNNG